MRAISSFRREVGISARSCRARFALRIRVSMSAIGSVSMARSPTAFRHSRNGAFVCELAEANPAEAELAVDRAGASAAVAAGVLPHRVARLPCGLRDERLLCHLYVPLSSPANGNPRPRSKA